MLLTYCNIYYKGPIKLCHSCKLLILKATYLNLNASKYIHIHIRIVKLIVRNIACRFPYHSRIIVLSSFSLTSSLPSNATLAKCVAFLLSNLVTTFQRNSREMCCLPSL